MTAVAAPTLGACVAVDVPARLERPLWVQARTCTSCGRPFPALQGDVDERCRGCDRDGPRLTPDGLEAWRAVRAAHAHWHQTKGLAGGPAGGSGSMEGHSNAAQRQAFLDASGAWWIHADTLFGELDRLFPEAWSEAVRP